MKALTAFAWLAITLSELPAQEWRLKLSSSDTAATYDADGSDRGEAEFRDVRGRLSPDGSQLATVNTTDGDADIFVSRADGTEARRLTDNDSIDSFPCWTADGKRLLFASIRSGKWQVYSMNPDGTDVQQLTEHRIGAWRPIAGPNGQFAYLIKHESRSKLRPVDLCVVRGEKHETLAKKTFITDHSWSPDGEKIAYSTLGKLIFHDLSTGMKKEVSLKSIDERLSSHGAYMIVWRPDSLAVACRLFFVGGRAVGTEMFGDDELFVISTEGETNWFRPDQPVQRVEWVR